MAFLICSLLLWTLHYKLFEGLYRNVYTPCGPEMCKKLCRRSDDSFSYILKDLSCWRINPRYANKKQICFQEDAFTCFRLHNVMLNSSFPTTEIVRNSPGRPLAVKFEKTPPTHCHGDLDVTTNTPNISLHQAIEEGNLCVVKYILSLGLDDINSNSGKVGRTPVMAAAVAGHMAVFTFLLDQGCDLTGTDDHGNPILHLACRGGNTDIVRYLVINRNFDIEKKEKNGYTPVMCAVAWGQRGVLDVLMRMCCNLTAVSHRKLNLLHIASAEDRLGMVKYILSHDILAMDSTDDTGRTPLLISAQRGHKNTLTFLVKKGCSMKALDSFGHNMLHMISYNGHANLLKHLFVQGIISNFTDGIEMTRNTTSVSYKSCKMVKCFNAYGYNILHLACIGGHVNVVKYILANKILHIDCRSSSGTTPVLISADMGHKKMVKYLVKKGSDLSVVDVKGNNILHIACYKGHTDIVKYLLTLDKVEKSKNNNYGLTPLQYAEFKGHSVILTIMKEYTA